MNKPIFCGMNMIYKCVLGDLTGKDLFRNPMIYAIGEATTNNGTKVMIFVDFRNGKKPKYLTRYLCNREVNFKDEDGKFLDEIEHFHKTAEEAEICMKKEQ